MAPWRKGGGKGGGGPELVPQEQMLERLHEVLYEEVGAAVAKVASMESKWTESDMTKRIVRYIYKSAGSPALLSMPWQEATSTFFRDAMSSYSGGCQEKQWFYDIDLSPTFATAVWELMTASRCSPRPSWEEVRDVAEDTYQSWMDETLREQAMWITVESIFDGDKTREKVFTSLKKTYKDALDSAQQSLRPMEDMERLQQFLSKWMEDALTRSWNALHDATGILDDKSSIKLFQRLMAPFGVDHPFSCVPASLTESIGRPPPAWKFIGQQVRSIFSRWAGPEFLSSKKRRRLAAAADEPEEEEDLGAGRGAGAGSAAAKGKGAGKVRGGFASAGASAAAPAVSAFAGASRAVAKRGARAQAAPERLPPQPPPRAQPLQEQPPPPRAAAQGRGCAAGGSRAGAGAAAGPLAGASGAPGARLPAGPGAGAGAPVRRMPPPPPPPPATRGGAAKAEGEEQAPADDVFFDEAEAEEAGGEAAEEGEGEAGGHTGHPSCTSEEDCQGSPSDVLIRHVLNGQDADVYCQVCWESFLLENPSLEGYELP